MTPLPPRQMEDELLPCPMCGGEIHLSSYGWHTIYCSPCDLRFHERENRLTREEIISLWNTRTAARVEELQRKNDSLEGLLNLIADALDRGETIPPLVPRLRTAPITQDDIDWANGVLKARHAAKTEDLK